MSWSELAKSKLYRRDTHDTFLISISIKPYRLAPSLPVGCSNYIAYTTHTTRQAAHHTCVQSLQSSLPPRLSTTGNRPVSLTRAGCGHHFIRGPPHGFCAMCTLPCPPRDQNVSVNMARKMA